MNRYVLIPEDTLRILPPEDGAGAAIEIFCSRTVIYFEIAQLREVCLLHHVRADRELVDALCFTAADRLLEQPQKVLIPTNRRQRSIFPKRRTISRQAATTTGIISNKSCKSCAS